MECVVRVWVICYEFLINYCVYGSFYWLVFGFWYNGCMVLGIVKMENCLFVYVCNYLSWFIGNKLCGVLRFIVYLKGFVGEKVEGILCWNFSYVVWVMVCVKELLVD